MDYRAYITRDDVEYEVTAKLYDHGRIYEDSWSDYGTQYEVEKNPEFHKFYAEDNCGKEMALTADEISDATEQMVAQYWGDC